uniref:7TM_GPCR_Srx domain-containing protein n=1 Tax=Panagrellus redivivus TaxID=6233 RepID=A0A7E4VET3_PANRE
MMCYKKSPLRKAYFFMSVLGYIVDVSSKLNEAIDEYSILSSYFQWHIYYFFGIWHFVLTLNRFTSVVFWQTYNVMWTPKMTVLWCIGILAYPTVLDITFVMIEPQPFYCIRYLYRAPCRTFYGNLGIRQSASNVLTSVGSIAMSVYTTVKIRKSTSAPKVAQRLLFQCIVSTLLFSAFMGFLIIYSIAWKNNDAALVYTAATVLNISLYFHQSFGVCWLVIICHFMVRSGSKEVKVTSITPTPVSVRSRAPSIAVSHS